MITLGAILTLATEILGLAGGVLAFLKIRRKVHEVHVLVNAQMVAALARIAQLAEALRAAGVEIPPGPGGPAGKDSSLVVKGQLLRGHGKLEMSLCVGARITQRDAAARAFLGPLDEGGGPLPHQPLKLIGAGMGLDHGPGRLAGLRVGQRAPEDVRRLMYPHVPDLPAGP